MAGDAPAAVDPVPQTRPHDSPKDESNLCRICRGEATSNEPLYHPCKCSGSIMFVHQECLMEWLSHSQKKHCELCKTSFRFTKLYSPDMPDKLPTDVFLSKAAKHTAQNLLYWMRGCLVLCTWAVWLPWTMRFVWWGLFWLADVGWVKDPNTYTRDVTALGSNTTTASNLTMAADINSALLSEIMRGPAILRLTSWVFRLLVVGNSKGVLNELTPDNHMQSQALITNSTQLSERGTLLSGVEMLSSLSPSPLANRVLIDVLEGQIITIALVALIILVLLIREWVVQQQPIANLVNDNNEAGHVIQRPAVQRQAGVQEQRPRRPVHGRRRTSLLLQEPDDYVKSILEQRNGDNVSPAISEKAEDISITRLQARVITLYRRESRRKSSGNNEEVLATEHKMQEILKDMEDSLGALKMVYAHAVQDADLAKLRTFRSCLRRFRRMLLFLPEETARPWREDIDEIKASMKNMIPLVKLKASLRGYNAHHRGSASDGQTQDTQAASTTAALSSNEDRAATPRARPTMPPRDESSVATEIQRSLQEGTSDNETEPTSGSEKPLSPGGASGHDSDTDGYENIEHMTNDIADKYTNVSTVDSWSETHPEVPSQENVESVETSTLHAGQPPSAVATGPGPSVAPPQDTAQSTSSLGTARDGSVGSSEGEIKGQIVDEVGKGTVGDGAAPMNVLTRVTDWLWGDLQEGPDAPEDPEDEQLAEGQEIAELPVHEADPPPAQLPQNPPVENEHEPPQEPPVENGNAVNGPAQAPGLFDIDAGDDAEDLEGIMELIGMQGGLGNLFTNAMFASVFVSCTIVIAVWIPFLVGKVALVMLAHPVSLVEAPFRCITFITNIVYEIGVMVAASILQWVILKPLLLSINNWQDIIPSALADWSFWRALELSAVDATRRSSSRLLDMLRSVIQNMDVAYSHLTFDSYFAVHALQSFATQASKWIADATVDTLNVGFDSLSSQDSAKHFMKYLMRQTEACVSGTIVALSQIHAWVLSGDWTITYSKPDFLQQTAPVAPVWTALDRSLVSIIGYGFLAFVGAIYFMRLAPLARGRQNKKIELVILEILQQAGGIAKVVLIISIEMLVFPLYCGLLLDGAMLPLFKDISLKSRIEWTFMSPWTSLFVHWFIGTAYMFHFALFVAMCRRIFRKGVLYFIRDPDDPTFHPVRDVLERSVISQLRKIASSALIYGGLVILCIGTLIWSLAWGFGGILPVKWRSTADANAFPLDLVVFLFTRPLVIKHFALSDWLHEMYKWFFRKYARYLRLTHFLFGEDNEDERGKVERRGFHLQPTAGKWLRVPASDAVRVGRGNKAFVEVDDDNRRLDGIPEPEHDAGKGPNNDDFKKIFVPHHFRFRMVVFIGCLWTVTAGVGFVFTILPLALGRGLLFMSFGSNAPINDVYAFAIGLLVVCATVSTGSKAKAKVFSRLSEAYRKRALAPRLRGPILEQLKSTTQDLVGLGARYGPRIASCFYVYSTLWVVIALMLSTLLHLYILGPLRMLVSSRNEPHVISISESAVIGIQLVRVTISILRWNAESRSARAIQAIFADGYSKPHAALATRYLFIPILLLITVAMLTPIACGQLASRILFISGQGTRSTYVRVFSYPATLGFAGSVWFAHLLIRATGRWRTRIRDEVFLIGERLHNYGEKKPPTNAPHSTTRVLS